MVGELLEKIFSVEVTDGLRLGATTTRPDTLHALTDKNNRCSDLL